MGHPEIKKDMWVKLKCSQNGNNPVVSHYMEKYPDGTVGQVFKEQSDKLFVVCFSCLGKGKMDRGLFRSIDLVPMTEYEIKVFKTLQNLG